MTATLLRNFVVSAVALAGLVWILFRDRAAGGSLAFNVPTLGLFAVAVLVAIVPIVLLSRVPQLGRPRSLRRLTVAVAYVGVLIYGCTWIFASIVGVSGAAVQALKLGIVALLIGALALVAVLAWNRNTYPPAGKIDERVIARRHETFGIAFQTLALVCAIECALWASREVIALPRTVDYTSLFLVTDAFLAMSLPAAILAWVEPDAVDD